MNIIRIDGPFFSVTATVYFPLPSNRDRVGVTPLIDLTPAQKPQRSGDQQNGQEKRHRRTLGVQFPRSKEKERPPQVRRYMGKNGHKKTSMAEACETRRRWLGAAAFNRAG